MLDLKLATYLRDNPAVFSIVLERLLGDQTDTKEPEATFKVRRKEIVLDPGEEEEYNNLGLPLHQRQPLAVGRVDDEEIQAEEEPEFTWDSLVDDMQYVIINMVINLANTDKSAFADLVILATVSKELSRKVSTRVKALELLFNVVPLYCRALFDYYEHPGIFNLFLGRVRESAPATHAGWLYLQKKEKRKAAFSKLLAHLKAKRPPHYELAMQQNGCDPVATALVMHDMAWDAAVFFTHSDVQKMYEHTYDYTWLYCMTRMKHLHRHSGMPRLTSLDNIPRKFDARAFGALIQRHLLDSPERALDPIADTVDRLNAHLEGTDWSGLYRDFSQIKAVWKRLCTTSDWTGLLRILATLNRDVSLDDRKYIAQMLAYWFEVQMKTAGVKLQVLVDFTTNATSPLVIIAGNHTARWFASIAYAIVAARNFFDYEDIVESFKSSWGNEYGSNPDFHHSAWLLFATGLKRGNFKLVRRMLETPPLVLTVLRLTDNQLHKEVLDLVCSGDFVRKRDRDGSMQLLVLHHISEHSPMMVKNHFDDNAHGECVSQAAIELVSPTIRIFKSSTKYQLMAYRFQLSIGKFDLNAFLAWAQEQKYSGNYECLEIAFYMHTSPAVSKQLLQYVSPSVAGMTAAEVKLLFTKLFVHTRGNDSRSTFAFFEFFKTAMSKVMIKSGAMNGNLIASFVTSARNPLILWKRIVAQFSAEATSEVRAAIFDAMWEMQPYRSPQFGPTEMANIFMYAVRTPIYHELTDYWDLAPPSTVLGKALNSLYKRAGATLDFDLGALETLYISTRKLDT